MTKIAKALGNNVPADARPALEAVKGVSRDNNVLKDAEDALKKIAPAK